MTIPPIIFSSFGFFLQKNVETSVSLLQWFPWVLLLLVLVALLIIQKRYLKINAEVKELRRLNATKNRFFSIMSHDLKSPFNSLMGFTEMLTLHAESMDTSQVINYSQIVHQTTRRLYLLVENLLHWSRAQLGTTQYKPERLDLNALTENIVNLLRLNAQEKDIVISFKLESGLTAFGDTDLYGTVVRNLISNSIKFSPVGSVVYVAGKPAGADIEIMISDTGVGMSKGQIDNLFQLGQPVSTPGTLNEKGTGLGLLLCKEFIEINKGTFWIKSHPGKGTQARFTLPAYLT